MTKPFPERRRVPCEVSVHLLHLFPYLLPNSVEIVGSGDRLPYQDDRAITIMLDGPFPRGTRQAEIEVRDDGLTRTVQVKPIPEEPT